MINLIKSNHFSYWHQRCRQRQQRKPQQGAYREMEGLCTVHVIWLRIYHIRITRHSIRSLIHIYFHNHLFSSMLNSSNTLSFSIYNLTSPNDVKYLQETGYHKQILLTQTPSPLISTKSQTPPTPLSTIPLTLIRTPIRPIRPHIRTSIHESIPTPAFLTILKTSNCIPGAFTGNLT
jgi:hypothetical protein